MYFFVNIYASAHSIRLSHELVFLALCKEHKMILNSFGTFANLNQTYTDVNIEYD